MNAKGPPPSWIVPPAGKKSLRIASNSIAMAPFVVLNILVSIYYVMKRMMFIAEKLIMKPKPKLMIKSRLMRGTQ